MQPGSYQPPNHGGVNVIFRDNKLRIWQNAFGHADEVFVQRA